MTFIHPPTEKLITSKHVPFESIQLLPGTFSNIINNIENISV